VIRSSAAQRRIRKAALELFAEKGSAALTVSELAAAAGVVRGTIYNSVASPERLFETIALELAEEMNEQIAASFAAIEDPAARLAIGIRLYVRRAHDEPAWGRFLAKFAMTDRSLRRLWTGAPMDDLTHGVEIGRYDIAPERITAALAIVAGSTLAAIVLVLDGLRTWRESGSEVAAMVLRSLGVSKDEAAALAALPLPALAEPP